MQNENKKAKIYQVHDEIIALIPEYRNDLYGLAILVKNRYGFWPILHYIDEAKEVAFSIPYQELDQTYFDQ